MNIIQLIAPAADAVSLEEVYTHLRLDPEGSPLSHPDDVMLQGFIKAAVTKIEQATRRALCEQRIRLVVPCFPSPARYFAGPSWDPDSYESTGSPAIVLYRPPLIAVNSVTYYDENNALQTVSAANYYTTDELLPRLLPVDSYSWPSVYNRPDAVRVDYTVGYAPTPSPATDADYRANIPKQLTAAILLEVQLLYDQLAPEQRRTLQDSIARLVASFRVETF